MEIVAQIQSLRERAPEQLLADVNRHLPGLTALLLVVLLGWAGARLLWSLLPGQPQFDWTERAPVTTAQLNSADISVDFRVIAAAHLFGEADAEPQVAQSLKAPETRLNLKLRGAIAATDETIAHAIIADGSNNAKVYFVEDPVPGGATLHQVYADRVILKRGGTLETLRLPKQSQNSGSSPATAGTRRSPPDVAANSLRATLNTDPTSFTQIIRPQPFMPNGEMKGYRVYPGRDRRAFAAMGLRPGDLVTEINGQALNNLRTGMEIFRQLGDANQMTVTIERNGTPMALTLDSSQFTNASGARR